MPRCLSTSQHAWQPLLLPAGHTPFCKLTAWQHITPHYSSASTCSLLLYNNSDVSWEELSLGRPSGRALRLLQYLARRQPAGEDSSFRLHVRAG